MLNAILAVLVGAVGGAAFLGGLICYWHVVVRGKGLGRDGKELF